MTTGRMDGTAEEALLWRISALREALLEITSIGDGFAAASITAAGALRVDNDNKQIMNQQGQQ